MTTSSSLGAVKIELQQAYGTRAKENASELMRQLYRIAAEHSPDPSTKVAAAVVSPDGVIIGLGVNAFPEGVVASKDRLQRPLKYKYIMHAEASAIADAARDGYATKSSMMVCPWACCPSCALFIASAGLSELVVHRPVFAKGGDHWKAEVAIGHQILKEANVKLTVLETVGAKVFATINGHVTEF